VSRIHNPQSKRGFTLIELLVTISIGMILLGGALAGFLQFQERRKVEAAAREVHQLYVMAKANAAARKVPEGYSGTTEACRNNAETRRLRGYQVTRSGSTYTLSAYCGSYTKSEKTYTLPSGITPSGQTTAVIFYSLPESGSLTNLGSSSIEIKISAGTNNEYVFTISRSGAVSNVKKL